MSGSGGKFNPKNLHYDRSATLPPFLARLHAQHAPGGGGGNFDGPDPILAARRRPTKKPRSGSEEAEDAPLVLDEQGNVVDTVSVGRDGTVMERSRVEGEGTKEGEEGGIREGTKAGEEGSKEGNHKRAVQEEKGVEIGASRKKKKKRKIGKVIGGDADDDDSDQEQDGHDGKPKGKKTEGTDAKDQSRKTEESLLGEKPKPTKTTTKKKATAKKIKLSFGDGDEEG
ncbi:hypothetical protein B0T13DRAFT_38728 [Neurospora crassa]|nr:hypothetical protein B0T13DRAFT_38728 [Neurospora crassa]